MKIDYVRVRLELRPEQKRSLNKWECTIDGETREVTSSSIEFHSESFLNISRRFKIEECGEVTMKWINTNFAVDAFGNPIYF
jgi:hypothetical protein